MCFHLINTQCLLWPSLFLSCGKAADSMRYHTDQRLLYRARYWVILMLLQMERASIIQILFCIFKLPKWLFPYCSQWHDLNIYGHLGWNQSGSALETKGQILEGENSVSVLSGVFTSAVLSNVFSAHLLVISLCGRYWCNILALWITAFSYLCEHVFYKFSYLYTIKHLCVTDLYRWENDSFYSSTSPLINNWQSF